MTDLEHNGESLISFIKTNKDFIYADCGPHPNKDIFINV